MRRHSTDEQRVRDPSLRALFERYGFDPEDPVSGLAVPDLLIEALAQAPLNPELAADDTRPGPRLERKHGHRIGRDPTDLEAETLELFACGWTMDHVCAHFNVTRETINSRLKSVYAKLDARDRTHAVTIAIARRVIPR